ncbi:SRPBCC family protein [Streptomyces sp. NPDC048643]|uniref:SRPBCC family protein n=1 Tax=Streptomyces sp. NPDC048643 TaxID=3155637 RepID=UPI00342AB931
MSTRVEVTVDIDRPIHDVYAYLADGLHDPEFNPRVLVMDRSPYGETELGTVFHSTVRNAGLTTHREFEIIDMAAPNRIRWHETSYHSITAGEGGYDLEPTADGGTRVHLFNILEGHDMGRLLLPLVGGRARKDAPALGRRMKAAVEGSI